MIGKKKTEMFHFSYCKINITRNLRGFLLCIRFGSSDWTRHPGKVAPAVSYHGLNASRGWEHREGSDGKGDKDDFTVVDPCREENEHGGQGIINTHRHT